jgi:hypothetical protein
VSEDIEKLKRRLEAYELFMWSMEHDFEVFSKDSTFDIPGMGKYTWEKLQKWKKEIESYTETGEYTD